MIKVLLRNPENGADIKSRFVAKEDEKRDEKQNVINSEEFVFYKNSEMEVDQKTALWALKTWGFLEKVKEINVEPVTKTTVIDDLSEEIFDEASDDLDFPKTQENASGEASASVEDAILTRFNKLKEKGWNNLQKSERELYSKLKDQLGIK